MSNTGFHMNRLGGRQHSIASDDDEMWYLDESLASSNVETIQNVECGPESFDQANSNTTPSSAQQVQAARYPDSFYEIDVIASLTILHNTMSI